MAHALYGKKCHHKSHGSVLQIKGYFGENIYDQIRSVMVEANLNQIQAELAIIGYVRGIIETLCRGQPVELPSIGVLVPAPYLKEKTRRRFPVACYQKTAPWDRNMGVLIYYSGHFKREIDDRCPYTDAHFKWGIRRCVNGARRNPWHQSKTHQPSGKAFGRGWATTMLDRWIRQGTGKYLPALGQPAYRMKRSSEMDEAVARDQGRLREQDRRDA